jgi:hypothetical protein
VKILLGDFNAKVEREEVFKPTIGNESLHQISNDNIVKVISFSISKQHNCQEYNVPTSQHS